MAEALVQNIVFGILVGALYGLAALGLSLVFGVTKFLNVAHGELLMFGGYATFWLFKLLDLNPFISLPLNILFLVFSGFYSKRQFKVNKRELKAPSYFLLEVNKIEVHKC